MDWLPGNSLLVLSSRVAPIVTSRTVRGHFAFEKTFDFKQKPEILNFKIRKFPVTSFTSITGLLERAA